ncbi:GntR family transcriptional regulator [Clostridium niameyense]|uniref:GntR family transcriptional regulator n=1 Tax=Clostridium niameyense TaxID=1622073 RepID=A0A6M0RBG0_9CLOT|nr:TrkA C-terminal domain-containing protein [Clostridium niameyense]NEZ47512.1 GntR family transcriptional regulator [Clostridium niameyense]
MKSSTGPLYKNIALDIANRIVRGKLKSDEKISGRSTLASMYNVSPETIRRAIALLEDMDVVVSNKGSGIEILSISAAEKFIERNKNNVYLKTVKENIVDILAQRRKLDKELEDNFNKILDLVERFENISPFTLIEIDIKEHCKFIGKKVNEVKFWQKTKATIVAFRRRDDIIISPGPEYIFTKGDILVVIGSKNVYNKVHKFLYE